MSAPYIPPSFGQPGCTRMTALPLMAVAMARRSMLASNLNVATRSIGTVSRTPSGSRSMSRPLCCFESRPSLGLRTLTTTRSRLNQSAPPSSSSPASKILATYDGPLSRTFTRLKLFSLGSLGLASFLTPILLLAPGEISLAGRVGLSITALATSGVSTALIAWIGTPYVGSMRLLSTPNAPVMEINTVSWKLQPQQTLVYDPTFLRPTSRPFAAWELTNSPPPLDARHEQLETKIAETFDVKSGKSLGKWIVKYDPETKTKVGQEWKLAGKVVVEGKPTRYFNVHEELLGDDWQVLG